MTADSRRKLVFMSRDTGNKGQIIVDIKDPWNPKVINYSTNPRATRRPASTTAASCGRSAASRRAGRAAQPGDTGLGDRHP